MNAKSTNTQNKLHNRVFPFKRTIQTAHSTREICLDSTHKLTY